MMVSFPQFEFITVRTVNNIIMYNTFSTDILRSSKITTGGGGHMQWLLADWVYPFC